MKKSVKNIPLKWDRNRRSDKDWRFDKVIRQKVELRKKSQASCNLSQRNFRRMEKSGRSFIHV
jgi:hypothetical protein